MNIEAYRLVFIQIKCDFCHTTNGAKLITPSYDTLYGVQACPDCYECGKISLQKSLDKIGAIDPLDFKKHEDIENFINLLNEGNFPIKRTSGEIEYDWTLDYNIPIRKYEKGWSFGVCKNQISKLLYINDFIDNCRYEEIKSVDESRQNLMKNLISSSHKVIEISNKGFYKTLSES